MFVLGDKVLGLDNLVFHNREDFYNYMKHFRGYSAIGAFEKRIIKKDIINI